MAIQIIGQDGATIAGVDATPKAVRTALYDNSGNRMGYAEYDAVTTASGLMSMALNDEQAVAMRGDRIGSIASAQHTPLLIESFEGTAIHPIRWLSTATTMAATQSSVAGLTINSGAITTVTTGYLLSSVRRFMKNQRAPLQAKFRARLARVNNSVMELGFGDASAFNGAHTTGAYWQVTAGGVTQPVVTFNSVDITGTDITSLLDPTKYYTWDVVLDDDEAVFFVQDTSTGLIVNRQVIRLPLTQQRLWSSTQVPLFVRCYNTGVAPASAPQMFVTDIYLLMLDALTNKLWPQVMACNDRGPNVHPTAGTQLATWTNSAEPASATLSNTAAGYTTLGGKFQFAAVAGAVTDYALFGFQVPSPTNFVMTGIDIDAWNVGAAVATTPTLLTWAVATGSTAVSLATATVSRIGVGSQMFAVGAAIGANADRRISKQFQTPLSCGAGRYVHVILRMPVGTATASQIIAGMVNIEGYFE